MTDSLSITVHAFASRVSMFVSGDKTLLPWKVNLSTSLRELSFSVEMSHIYIYIYIYMCVCLCVCVCVCIYKVDILGEKKREE